MKFEQLGIIGCGLMGASFALAAKRAGIVKRVVGYSKSPTTTESAMAAGILDETASSALHAVSGSDLVLIAVPVGSMPKIFTDIVSLIGADTVVMDVGSTKQDVVTAARTYLKGKISHFVPAHPIAGKNLSGYQAAEANLFDDAKVVITPMDETKQVYLDQAIEIWKALGSKVQLMSAEEHDEALGVVSHLPHLLSFAYMNSVIANPKGTEFLTLAGEGFRDFTRIASAEPYMWRDVALANRKEMLAQIAAYKKVLTQYEKIIQKEDGLALLDLLQEASDVRSVWALGDESRLIPHGPNAEDLHLEETTPGLFGRLFGRKKST